MFWKMIDIVNNYPWLLPVLSCVSLFGMFYSARQMRAIKTAKWLEELGQFEPINEKLLNEAFDSAKDEGNDQLFLDLLQKVRRAYGHQGVTIGHLVWINELISEGIKDPKTIPSFNRSEYKKHERI